MITGRSLQKQFTTDGGQIVQALDNVSFDVAQGEFFVLLGPSGSGKTTTLRSVAGIETADSGKISIGGSAVFSSDDNVNLPAEERPVAMVFQSYALWPHMNVHKNIVFPLRKGVRKVPEKVIKQRVEQVVETLQLTPYLYRPISQLSGGQQQRVALARALALEPDVLLMDEPLSNLDAKLRASLRVEIKNLTRSLGITTLYVTHDQVEAMVMGDQIAVMDHGGIAEQGTPSQLYRRPANEFVAQFLGEMNFIPAKMDESRATASSPLGIVQLEELHDPTIGQEFKLGFRPEDVTLGHTDGAVNFTARVKQSYYIGDALLCDLETQNTTFSARLTNKANLKQDENIPVSILHSDFTVFHKADG